MQVIDSLGSFQDLNDGSLALDFQDLSVTQDRRVAWIGHEITEDDVDLPIGIAGI